MRFVVSGPKFAGRYSPNAKGIVVNQLVYQILLFGLKSLKIASNFARFWPPFLDKKKPKFLDVQYKAQTNCDHEKKFTAIG